MIKIHCQRKNICGYLEDLEISLENSNECDRSDECN